MEIDDTGERLIAEGNEQTLTYGEHLSRYLAVKGVVQDKTVLDIASGTGYGTQLIARYAKKVYGIDYSEDAIAYCKKYHPSANVEYRVGDAHDIPLADNAVDAVVSLETIEHLKSPEKFVAEVKRVMNDTGVFVVSTPNDDEFIEGNVFHIHEFTLKELKKLLEKHFTYSKYYYQGVYYAAALLDEPSFTSPQDWEGMVHKTFGQPINKAIYFIALASDKPLKDTLTPNVVVADRWNAKEDVLRDQARQDHLHSLEQQIENREQRLSNNYKENEALQARNRAMQAELESIKSSRGWKLLEKGWRIKGRFTPKKQR